MQVHNSSRTSAVTLSTFALEDFSNVTIYSDFSCKSINTKWAVMSQVKQIPCLIFSGSVHFLKIAEVDCEPLFNP